jgi:4-diphosphocytidyl-2-C-methyl-D-erythritol kinase
MAAGAAVGARTLRTTAPAKVNLGLRITARRPDGYHELRSVFLRLDLADDLTLGDAPGRDDRLEVDGDPECPIGDNLVLTAVEAFRATAARSGALVEGVAIRLRKRIPMAAGLAGGSSDAAAILRLLARRHPGAVDDLALAPLAQRLGSDVPFFVAAAGAAVVTGAGVELDPLPPPIEPLGVLLVTPAVRLATGRVFDAWDALHPDGADTLEGPDAGERLASELRAGAPPAAVVELAPALRDANDLWAGAVALEPALAGWRDDLEGRLGRPVLMTGSGSTLFVLSASPEEARRAAEGLRADLPVGLEGALLYACASTTPYPPEVVTMEEGA